MLGTADGGLGLGAEAQWGAGGSYEYDPSSTALQVGGDPQDEGWPSPRGSPSVDAMAAASAGAGAGAGGAARTVALQAEALAKVQAFGRGGGEAGAHESPSVGDSPGEASTDSEEWPDLPAPPDIKQCI
jgi:hypothetical protein